YGPRGCTEHVSIYLGGKQYIHAPYPGQVVKIADMTYYMPSFARRIIQ
ncbi:NlpC/P60 family protein, partial [uncultured Abiotrophia sp.]